MPKTIWEFYISIEDTAEVEMLVGAKVLSCQYRPTQHREGAIVMYAMVESTAPAETRYFNLYGTRHTLGANCGKYIATVEMGDGLVWHIFE